MKKKSDDKVGGVERENGRGGNDRGNVYGIFCDDMGGEKVARQRPHFPDAPTWKIAATQLPSDTNYEISSVSSNEGYFRGETRSMFRIKLIHHR